ncbi:MAG TPA: DUF883 family protein [Ramlibacter sp.]|uniref:DUF883 family protein n=1 Tax=Ramlibacter sp. TaxID=1917967 RepID=UPI002C66E9A0|nr:DUF883 family protein [Ramlibacter sp.]HVZ42856.1 DUF883 family protein [Ramlibacter sp.]
MNDVTQTPPAAGEQRLADDLRTVIADAEQLLRHAVRDASQSYADARTRLEGSLKTAKDELAVFEKAALERAMAGARATDAYVRENPWQAVGVGAAIGLLAGYILGRK